MSKMLSAVFLVKNNRIIISHHDMLNVLFIDMIDRFAFGSWIIYVGHMLHGNYIKSTHC